MFADFITALWSVLLDLSPALLAGLFLAGLLHVFLPQGLIHRTLSRPGLGSVWRAVLVGVPMPLCSCGVVPTALGLRKDGASKGATTAFLISTPQTGVDSIFVSASFLGWPFAFFKLVAAAITGVIGGLIADKVDPGEIPDPPTVTSREEKHAGHRIVEAIDYGVHDLFGAIDRWIVFGVVVAAAITAATPPDFFAQTSWTQGLTGMLIMLAIALPLYVCATGSVPIAASFVAAGMPAGTALVFLMAGPATNMATIGAIYRALGARIVAVYLGTVIIMSIGLGLTFDSILPSAAATPMHEHGGTDWVATISALLVMALWLYLEIRRLRARAAAPSPEDPDVDLTLNVEGMSCQHCVANVKRTLEDMDGVDSATPDLDSGTVAVSGAVLDVAKMRAAIEGAGYSVKD
ncbi:MAG: permease [Gammaproteobacteria bacterium]